MQASVRRTPVPLERKAHVSVIIVRESIGDAQPLTDEAMLCDMLRVKERYAKIGLNLTWSITAIDLQSGIDLSDGLDTRILINSEMKEADLGVPEIGGVTTC